MELHDKNQPEALPYQKLAFIGHKTKRAKWVMVGWDERLLVSEG